MSEVTSTLAALVPEIMVALDGLVGERVFPVVTGDGEAQPTIIALDASGVPVAVEVVGNLDHRVLLQALNHAGAVGRMSRGQLAASYAGGLAAFGRDLQQYFETVPFRRTAPGNRGARLVIVCSDAHDEVLNAIDFLNRPELPIKVLRAKALESRDGMSFIDASPLVINPNSPPSQPEALGSTAASRLRVAAVDNRGVSLPDGEQVTPHHPETRIAEVVASAPARNSDDMVGFLGHLTNSGTVSTGAAPKLLSRKARRLAEAQSQSGVGAEHPTMTAGGFVAPAAKPAAGVGVAPSEPAVVGTPKIQPAPVADVASSEPAVVSTPKIQPAPVAAPTHNIVSGDDAYEQYYSASETPPQPGSRRARRLAAQTRVSQQPNNIHQAIARAKAALEGPLLPLIAAESQGDPSKIADKAPAIGYLNSRSQQRRARASATKNRDEPIEFTGVFAKGAQASDHLSWDTTTLPVIARPITTTLPVGEIAGQARNDE